MNCAKTRSLQLLPSLTLRATMSRNAQLQNALARDRASIESVRHMNHVLFDYRHVPQLDPSSTSPKLGAARPFPVLTRVRVPGISWLTVANGDRVCAGADFAAKGRLMDDFLAIVECLLAHPTSVSIMQTAGSTRMVLAKQRICMAHSIITQDSVLDDQP